MKSVVPLGLGFDAHLLSQVKNLGYGIGCADLGLKPQAMKSVVPLGLGS